jgi:two-component sensor histidine kinase
LFSASWTELGGPSVIPPVHRGFGTTVITKMIEMGLDGETRLTYGASGLVWQFICPLANVLEQM